MVLLQNWFRDNKLSLNLSKTKFMVFTNKKCSETVNLSFNGIYIERVPEFRFLGVIIDEKLKWKSHIAYVKKKVSKNLSVLSKAKYVLNYEAMRILYCSMILPYFLYCLEVWGNSYSSNLMPLIVLQKRAIRTINRAASKEHTNELFLKSRLLKLKDLVNLQTLIIMYKAKQYVTICHTKHVYTK